MSELNMKVLEGLKTVSYEVVEELPDVTGKIYLLQKEVVNDKGKVVRTVYEEWMFQPYKIEELDPEKYKECEEYSKDLGDA